MIILFNKKYLHQVLLPDLGWKKEKEGRYVKLWINPERSIALSLSFFKKEPAIPTLKDLAVLRNFYRSGIVQSGGGIIEVNKIDLKGLSAIRTIFKIPQEPEGILYIASLTIPFQNSSYVIKIEAPETDIFGLRSFANEENKASDPYDPNFNEGSLMSRFEEMKSDKDFPTHPLTMVRTLLEQIESEISFTEKLLKTAPFDK